MKNFLQWMYLNVALKICSRNVGKHVFTIHWYSEYVNSRCRVKLDDDGSRIYMEKPEHIIEEILY